MDTSGPLTPVTQKAQGIIAIRDGCYGLGLQGPGHPLMVIPGSYNDCRPEEITWPVFARPCPFQPRHGFVDSIRVHDWAEVIALLQKAKTADRYNPVELVLAPYLTGRVSAVATNAGVTWGRGNDGVTAGKDSQALFIPVKTSTKAWREGIEFIVYNRNHAFTIPDFSYLEIVENEGDMCLVQIRDGPEQPDGVNHVVRKTRVQYILRARSHYDLLEWEECVRKAASHIGAVIWAPGMSLASHFCVHGIESGIPVITDHEVTVGDVIEPTKNRTSALVKHDYVKIAALISETLASNLDLSEVRSQKDAILTAVATTQAQFCWGREAHLLRLRGLSVAVLLKAVLASCAGEIRHWPSEEGPRVDIPSLYEVLNGVDNRQFRRRAIYMNVFNDNFTFAHMERALRAAETDLGHDCWTRSFGGPRWAEVANAGIELVSVTRRFNASPCASTWSIVVQSANRMINTSHNNGKCLTKWLETGALAAISLAPTLGFLNPYVTKVALKMTDEGAKS